MIVSGRAFGQAVNGTVVGTVTDSSGAVVPKAQVTITLTGQSATYTTQTNESGNFTEPDLPPGVYTVGIVAPGFKKEARENITLDTNTTQRVDVALVPGNTSETVTVSAAPPLLQTDRADISTTISSEQLSSMPLSSGNSFQSALNTVPGIAPVVFNNSQFFNSNNDLSANANGQSSYVNLYQIEGIDNDERTGIHIMLVPPAAAIANVDITTNNFEAEFGRAVGTVVNVTLKSGTNKIHGSVFANMENNGVNARGFFQKSPDTRLVYNYDGGSIGAPILKNRLFIFGDFLRVSDHEEANNLATIPFYNVSGNVLNLSEYKGQAYDPNTGDTADCLGATANSNCGIGRTPFAGNMIPLSNPGVSAAAVTVLQDIDAIARNPAINLASSAYLAGATSNNLSENLAFHKDFISYDIKSDYTISEKSHLSYRFSHQNVNTVQAPTFGAFLGGPASGGFEGPGVAAAYSTGVNFDHSFSPTLFTEARAGVAHYRNSALETDYGINDAAKLLIPGNGPNGTNKSAQTSGQIAVNLGDGFSGPMIGYSPSLPWLRAESNIDFANNWTKLIGNHTLKAGVDIRRVRDDLLQGNNNAAAGSFNYNSSNDGQTSVPVGCTAFNGSCTGQANDVAAFLFNVPSSVGQDTNSTFPAYRQTWYFFFLSDKWQVSPKLTLDIGGRYELYPSATPRKAGGFVNYNPATNQLVMAGVGGQPSNLGLQTVYRNFAPRLGAAYRVNEKLVVRGGIGVSFVPFLDNNYAYNYPIKTSTNYNAGTPYGPALNPAGGVVNLATGIPATPTVAFASDGTLTESAANGTIGLGNLYIPLNFKNAYVTSWNVVLQQALPHDMSFQIAYVANHGTDIDVEQNINLPRIYGQGANYDPLRNGPDGQTPTFGKTASVTEYSLGYSSDYQSLQVEFKKRFAHGVGFASAFTWGKAEGYATGAQLGGLFSWAGPAHRSWGVLDFDRTRNFEQTVTYELPAGRGHRYFNSGISQLVFGGWRTSAVISAVSGTPFSITASSATSGTTQTANQIGPYRVLHHVAGGNISSYPQWFDSGPSGAGAYFQQPACAAYTPLNQVPCPFGNTGRNQFRGPGFLSDNLSLFKSFPIFRESQLEARVDAFNATNTPAFANPSNSITSSNFGQITSILSSGAGNVNGVGGPRVLQASVKITF
ncbi:MAG TPA: TonB-dependent receptor [Acidobacteriaceae bacterium]|nr:TonB-dependent receptor [Acidobacteriaceae bacterium]